MNRISTMKNDNDLKMVVTLWPWLQPQQFYRKVILDLTQRGIKTITRLGEYVQDKKWIPKMLIFHLTYDNLLCYYTYELYLTLFITY